MKSISELQGVACHMVAVLPTTRHKRTHPPCVYWAWFYGAFIRSV